MSDHVYTVLFICTGNSARSIMAEALMTHLGKGCFRGLSAGSHPTGRVHPMALEALREAGVPTDGLRSKSWEEFAGPAAPPLDFALTVCDKAAGESCPVWPGQPMTAHWGVEDPAAYVASDDKARQVFHRVMLVLRRRIELFLSLPLASLDSLSLQSRLREIGSA
jgi:protein-tyrosine-phosphatase